MNFRRVMIGMSLGMAIASQAIDINGDFAKVEKNFPVGWLQNKEDWAKPFGTVSIVPDGKNNLLKITSNGNITGIYTAGVIEGQAENEFVLMIKGQGKGTLRIGILNYDANRQWIESEIRLISLSGKKEEFRHTFEIKNYKGRTTKYIRPYIGVAKDGEVLINSFQIRKRQPE